MLGERSKKSRREPPLMDDIRQLADDIFREKVHRARAMSPGRKVLLGPELFDRVCQIALGGIRSQMPGATEEEHRRELSRRLKIARRLNDAGLYHPVEVTE